MNSSFSLQPLHLKQGAEIILSGNISKIKKIKDQ
jgi:hypothetical protein